MKIAYAYPVNGSPPKEYSTSDSLNDKLASLSSSSVNDSKSAETLVAGTPSPELERAMRKIIENPFLVRKDAQQSDGAVFTNSKEHAEKMKQAGIKAHYVSDKVQGAVNKWNWDVFGFLQGQGGDSQRHFLGVLKQVNQLEKKFGLADFSLNFKLQNDKLVISHPKLDEQLKTKLEEELNKDELGIKSNFKSLLNYLGKAAYRHLLETNGTMRWNESEGDVELSNLTAFAAVVTERFEKTGKIELPPIKSPYGSNNLTHLSLQDFYISNSGLKSIINYSSSDYELILSGQRSNYEYINHFENLYAQTTEHMLKNLDAKQYVLHDKFGYLNYIKTGSAVNETA